MAKSTRGGAGGGTFTTAQRRSTNEAIDRAVNLTSAFDSSATTAQRQKNLKYNIVSAVSSELGISKSRATTLVNQELKKRKRK
jgi:hypothetical protein